MSFLYVVTPLLDDEAFTRWLSEFGIMPPPGATSRFPTVREIRFLLEHLDGFSFEVSGGNTHWDADIFACGQSSERGEGEYTTLWVRNYEGNERSRFPFVFAKDLLGSCSSSSNASPRSVVRLSLSLILVVFPFLLLRKPIATEHIMYGTHNSPEERKDEMSAPIILPPLETEVHHELRRCYEQASNPETCTRYQMLLLSLRGQTSSQIAQTVLRSQDTVVCVLKRFLSGGLDAVPRRMAPGRKRQVTASWEAELLRVIELDPHARWARHGQLDHRAACGVPGPADRHGGSPKRQCACTYTPMITSANVPLGPSGAKPKRKRITWETPAGRGSFSRYDRTRTSTRP